MEVIILKDAQEVEKMGGRLLAHQVASKPDSVLGLATGATMVGVYKFLTQRHEQGLDFSKVRSFNLDEYYGLGPHHPCSYHTYMCHHLFERVNIQPENTRVPDGLAHDVAAHCKEYESAIAQAGGIDLQLLGLGEDGHIGFNEPSSSLSAGMRIKTLTPMTRRTNQRDFSAGETMPMHVLTLGVGNILAAHRCVLLAHGSQKAPAIQSMVEGPISAMCPASALQQHPCCTVIVDESAAAFLKLADYFRCVYKHKPEWQRKMLED